MSSDHNLPYEDSELTMTRSRSSQRDIMTLQVVMGKKEVSRLIELKEQF